MIFLSHVRTNDMGSLNQSFWYTGGSLIVNECILNLWSIQPPTVRPVNRVQGVDVDLWVEEDLNPWNNPGSGWHGPLDDHVPSYSFRNRW